MGVFRVTQSFIPHFRENKSGLFITTTSLGGFIGFPLNGIYNATKFALEGWSEGMSFELAQHNIGIKTVAPGAIATDFGGRSLDKRTHPAYKETEDKLFATIDTMLAAAASAEEIAQVVYEAATDGKDQVSYIAGADATALCQRQSEIGREAMRKELGKSILG
ncbi:SDR family NAD(P)-dependent oxidoreductase [Chryseobacterium arachidis]|uniref:SDR family NAD(P)-dependent oxidoreductase n=1 Tax=Chryseobacterium arachidis TaxID=1416778 RepID=UPI003616D352